VTSIGEDLQIGGNAVLTSLTGLNNVTSIGEDLQIGGNPVLTSLTGLNNVNSIGGELWVSGNESLSNLDGLENLNSIEGDLTIGYWDYPSGGNPSLSSLMGLSNVTLINGSITIVDNTILTSLTGLDYIEPNSITDLTIHNNLILSVCAVQSVCDYLVSPNGEIDIHDNAPGCNSQEGVEKACDSISSIGELNSEESFTISPNPLESTTLIQYTLHHNSPVTLKIHDLSGRVVNILVNEFQQQGEQKVIFNVTALPPGVYFCVLKTKEGIQTKKIVKL